METTARAQHTPGPWHTGVRVARPGVYGPMGEWIADCDPMEVDEPDAAANARLIAAAPALLAALETLHSHTRKGPCPGPRCYNVIHETVDSLVAQARGDA